MQNRGLHHQEDPPAFRSRTGNPLENSILTASTVEVAMRPERAIVISLAAGRATATFPSRVHADAIDIVLNRLATDAIFLDLASIAAETNRRICTVSESEGLILAALIPAHFLGRAARVTADAALAAGAAGLASIARRFRGAAGTGWADALLGSVATRLAAAGALLCFAAETLVSVQAGLALQATLSAAEEVLFLASSWAARTHEAGFPVAEGGG